MVYNQNTYHLIYDTIGALRRIVDNAGTIIGEITYDSFGNIQSTKMPLETACIGFAGGMNLYGYVLGDPVNFVDSTGLYDSYSFTHDATNVFAGFGDAITFDLTAEFRETYGYGGVVDKCSSLYAAGEYAGYVTGASALLKKGLNTVRPKNGFWHSPHLNFGTRKNPQWRKHFQLQWSRLHPNLESTRIPYGPKFLLKHGKNNLKN